MEPLAIRPRLLSGRWIAVIAVLTTAVTTVATLGPAFRRIEAASAATLVRLAGGATVVLAGDELYVVPDGRRGFVVDVVAGCSSLTAVACLAVLAALVARWRVPARRAALAWAAAAAVVVVGNIARLAATVLIGTHRDPAAMERFHDGAATWFAAALIITAVAVLLAIARHVPDEPEPIS